MSRYYSFRPYVSAAQRRRKAEAAAKKLSKNGRALSPVQIEGRRIANTFWGKSWCDNLESYSDYENRLPRGRTYARNGSVLDLQIASGSISALVQGSSLYKVAISIHPLPPRRWNDFKQSCAGKVASVLDLLQGRLSKEILADITAQKTGLFPSPKEIKIECSCPDWAGLCKHAAAVLYGIGARLDTQPEMFFTLRGAEMEDLITAATAAAISPVNGSPADDPALSGADLSDIFGVDIEQSSNGKPETPPPASPKPKPIRSSKPEKKAAPAKKARPALKKRRAIRTSARSKSPARGARKRKLASG